MGTTVISPVLQMKKLNHRKVQKRAHSHTGMKQWSQDLNQGSLAAQMGPSLPLISWALGANVPTAFKPLLQTKWLVASIHTP